MTIHISLGEMPSHFAELVQSIRQGEEVLLLEDGIAFARVVPADPLANLEHLPAHNVAEAFRGKLGLIARDDIPTDLARNDEQYFAELMAEKHQTDHHLIRCFACE
jgi:antitoxin (DNA-binding transcriptional repressor) of toxin-antitoxin stability system